MQGDATASGVLFAQAFADQCRRWASRDSSADEKSTAWSVAYRLALAEQEGRAFIRLTEIEAQNLLATGLLEKASENHSSNAITRSGKPMALDPSGRLYLARYFYAEKDLATSLAARNHALPNLPGSAPGEAAQDLLARLFPNAEDEAQRQAVALALTRKLVILSGSPGTGKTRTIARLLACLLADTPALRVALAAPTGKAAARMQESLADAARDFPPAIAERLPTETFTLHRLLGLAADGSPPRHHAGNLLPFDVLIVDEASMIDLALAVQLCAATPAAARLILVGDRAQLPAVEAGGFFAALMETEALREAVIQLEKNYRFKDDSPLGRLIAALAKGEGDRALACFANTNTNTNANANENAGSDLQWIESVGQSLLPQEITALAEGFAAWRAAFAAWSPGDDPQPLFDALGEFRVLCVLREGERGVLALNARLSRLFAPEQNTEQRAGRLFPGQVIIVTRNDPGARLYNGDTGILLPVPATKSGQAGLKACFPDAGQKEKGWRYLDPARLPEFETVFALTAHKAQGSEFARVALVLPGQDNPILTRELLYTAVTRARKRVLLSGDPRLFSLALNRLCPSASGLSDRFAELAAAESRKPAL